MKGPRDGPPLELVEKPRWPYRDALRWMEDTHARVRAGGPMAFAIGEHDPAVVTLGRHADPAQVLLPNALAASGTEVVRVERGGGATWHGPGQLVLYPVVALARLGLGPARLAHLLERVAVRVLAELGIEAAADPRRPGVYVGGPSGPKIASIGLRIRDGVSLHGLSLNVENDPAAFAPIAACGEAGAPVTSIALERAQGGAAALALEAVAGRLASAFRAEVVVGCSGGGDRPTRAETGPARQENDPP